MRVVPIDATSFEVVETRGEGLRAIWCAAADFVLHGRGQKHSKRLYVKTPRGASVTVAGRKGTVFTTDVNTLPVEPQKSYSVSVKVAGLGLPTYHAHEFCNIDLDRFDRISLLWWRY